MGEHININKRQYSRANSPVENRLAMSRTTLLYLIMWQIPGTILLFIIGLLISSYAPYMKVPYCMCKYVKGH